MKKKVENVSKSNGSKFFGKLRKWVYGSGAVITMLITSVVPVSAATVNPNLDTVDMVGGIIEFIIEVAKWMGFVVVASGIFMFVFAYKDDNAEAQSRAARFAVVGAILLALKPILKTTGLITG